MEWGYTTNLFKGIIFHKPIRIRFPVIHWNVRKSMAVRLPALPWSYGWSTYPNPPPRNKALIRQK